MVPRHLLVLLILLPSFGGGCVALNLPSERYDDPEAAVGQPPGIDSLLLWAPRRDGSTAAAPPSESIDSTSEAIDPASEPHASGRLPAVPWPRFHPVPTRPVY